MLLSETSAGRHTDTPTEEYKMARCVTLPITEGNDDDYADYITRTVAPVATVGQVCLTDDGVTISIPEAGVRMLRELTPNDDGYMDDEDRLWIGGADYRTWTDARNAP